MARSILPSTAYSSTRAKVQLRREARRAARIQVGRLVVDPEAWDDAAGLDEDDTVPRIRQIVGWRRDKDKLNHFERWAVKVTVALPVMSRLAHLRAMLPKGLIGQHALEHLKRRDAFRNPVQKAIDDARWGIWKRQRVHLDRGELAQLLRQIVQSDAHAALNRALGWAQFHCEREGRVNGQYTRRLHGLDDVLPFLDAVPDGLKDAVDAFAKRFKLFRGDVERIEADLPFRYAPRPQLKGWRF